MTATQPRTPGRLTTLDPFELGASVLQSLGVAQDPLDVGCVDWYLYPINRNARPAGSHGAPRGGAAVPSRGNPSA
jgi:hypothetical protein